MQFEAEIMASNEEGVLERILRTCRHRGYVITAFHAAVEPLTGRFQIKFAGESARPPTLLTRQLEKLYDVIEVSVEAKREVVTHYEEKRVHHTQVREAVYARISNG